MKQHYTAGTMLSRAVGMQGFDRLVRICHFLLESAGLPGDVVELGCNHGDTAAVMACVTDKRIWLYDSFDGLPEPQDYEHQANPAMLRRGHMQATEDQVRTRFNDANRPQPTIVKGWFKDVRSDQLPERIAFAHLDGDLFESITQSLELVYPRLSPGAYCVIDDYLCPLFPGVAMAVGRFLRDKPERTIVPPGLLGQAAHHGYFRKL